MYELYHGCHYTFKLAQAIHLEPTVLACVVVMRPDLLRMPEPNIVILYLEHANVIPSGQERLATLMLTNAWYVKYIILSGLEGLLTVMLRNVWYVVNVIPSGRVELATVVLVNARYVIHYYCSS